MRHSQPWTALPKTYYLGHQALQDSALGKVHCSIEYIENQVPS